MNEILIFFKKEELDLMLKSLVRTFKETVSESDTLTENELNQIKLINKIHEEVAKDKEDTLKIS